MLSRTTPRRSKYVIAAFCLALAATSTLASAATLRTNITADPSMIDPVTVSELIADDVLRNVYEGFVTTDKDGKVVPALAESWTPINDNKGFRFVLKKGVKFHSGRPFTAKDVKWSFEQMLIPANKGGLGVDFLKNVVGAEDMTAGKATELKGVRIIDDNTVEVDLVKPDVLFPIYQFYFWDSGIVAEQGADWYTKVSAGTGPFKFKAWDRGRSVELTRNDDYWKGAPKIDGISFLIVPSQDTALSMFETGELDLMYVDNATAGRVVRDEKYAPFEIKMAAAQVNYIGMNQALYEPFKDKRVREAVCHAIDRAGMVKGLQGGAGFPLYGQVPPGFAGYEPDIKPIAYDPDLAKKLMAEAGFPDGKGLPPIKISSTEPNKTEIAYLANQFKTVLGFPVEVEISERATHIKRMNAGEIPFFSWGWSADYADPETFLGEMWDGNSPYNRARWKNAEFDKIMAEAAETADIDKRYVLYHKAENVLIDDWGTCGTVVRMQVALKQPKVDGVVLTSFRFQPFNNVTIAP